MAQPIYRYSHPAGQQKPNVGTNLGLWFNRFYNAFDHDWTVPEDGKSGWITQVAGRHEMSAEFDRLKTRTESLAKALGAECDDFTTQWHLATGLGISHPVENGFTWHHTLGLPYLPASGVKGLLRGWVDAWMEHADEPQKKALIVRWFGTFAGEEEGVAGNLIFFDALPVAPVELACDVMTPHMGKWYEQGETITEQDYATTAPADWHSPVPVPFLVVRKATFRFMIAPRLVGSSEQDLQTRADVAEALRQLGQALLYVGAGAKTAAGYGRMTSDKAAQAQKAEKDRQELEEAGVKQEITVWCGAKASWDKGKSSLSVVAEDGGKAQISGEEAKKKLDALTEATRLRLMSGKKPVRLDATIEIKGNQTILQSVRQST